jgi:hypothetical protein
MINDASQKHKASQRHWVCYIARAVFQEPAGEILRSKQCISYHSTANYCKASKATHAESKRRRAEPPVIPGSYVYWGPSYARTQHRMTNHHNTLCFPSFLSCSPHSSLCEQLVGRPSPKQELSLDYDGAANAGCAALLEPT